MTQQSKAAYATGTPVRILIRAGYVETGRGETATSFLGSLEPGETGEYIGPHKTLADWHIVRHAKGDVPLSIGQFERAS